MKTHKWLMMLVTLLLITGCSQNETSSSKKVLETESAINENLVETQKGNTDKKSKDEAKEKKEQETKKSEVINEKEITHKKDDSSKLVKEEVKEQTKEESKPIEKLPTDTPPPSQDDSVIEVPETPIVEEPVKQEAMAQSVMNQINAYRQQHGLQPLAQSSYHQQKADSHAYAMASQRALWHMDNGECITNSPDPFSAWVNSPEHNEILLRENNSQGVVSIYYVDGYYYSVFKTSW